MDYFNGLNKPLFFKFPEQVEMYKGSIENLYIHFKAQNAYKI